MAIRVAVGVQIGVWHGRGEERVTPATHRPTKLGRRKEVQRVYLCDFDVQKLPAAITGSGSSSCRLPCLARGLAHELGP